MRIKYKALLAALTLSGYLALPAMPARCDEAPRTIEVVRETRHRNIFEIPVYIIPKLGYSFVSVQNGVADRNKKVSIEGTLLHMSFSRLLEEISNDCLKKGNMEVKSRSSFIWNGSRAELMKIFQQNGNTTVGKWVLIVDRGADKCWMISGSYRAKDMNAAQNVLDMIKSAWWEEEKNASAPWPLGGHIETAGTPFRIAGFRQNALIYTKDGKIPTQHADHALFVISTQTRIVPQEKHETYANDLISGVEAGAKLDIISQNNETVDGLPAVVTVAYTADEPRSLIYQAAVFRSSKVTTLVGIARGDAAKNLEYFHKMTASYKDSL